jgi:hypothetical protein
MSKAKKKNFSLRSLLKIKKSEQNKFFLLMFAITVLIVAVAICLSVFIKNYAGIVHLSTTMEGSNVVDRRKNITYELAPMCYIVDMDKTEVYAKYKDVKFYKVLGIDPKVMIATETEGVIDIYCSTEYELPSFEEFKADKALICAVEKISYAVGALTVEQAKIASDLLLNGEKCEYPGNIDNDSVQHIYFGSDAHEYLYYSVRYFEDNKGNRYLYDRERSVCVKMGDALKDVLSKE